jgi:hypothetical protein
MRVRYHKYKGRYSDLARHYRELERDREKVKVRKLLLFYQNINYSPFAVLRSTY